MEEDVQILTSSFKKRFGSLGMWKQCVCTLYPGYISITQGYSSPITTKINLTSKTTFRDIVASHPGQFAISDNLSAHYFIAESELVKTKWRETITSLQMSKKSLIITDFNILSTLGRGHFGKVLLAEHKETHDIFALKAIKKAMLLDEEKIDTIFTERNILCGCSHPFIVSMYFAFQSSKKFYIGLEYVTGGALFKFIQIGRKMEVDEVKFYAAEVVLAIQYLHSKGIVYRDLKLENVLLCADGHIKLTDFGLSKELSIEKDGNVGTTSTFCGTNEYIPPEMILDKSYGLEIDWWTLGVFIYEFLFSKTPFYNKNLKQMYDNILHKEPKFPKETPDDVVLFISKLLEKDPAKRPTFHEITEDPFFENIDWDDAYIKRMVPPYIPKSVSIRKLSKNKRERLDSDAPSVDSLEKFEGFSFEGGF